MLNTIEILSIKHNFSNNQHCYAITYLENNKKVSAVISRDFELTKEDILEILKSFYDA